ncbi:glycosyltransferase [Desemzia sp. FAM 23990]|uniref:glycosyltransferase n=1 Tax=Desemzia sp. FAM 23990 TaxID=3259520 RepID=UPI003889C27F
MKIMVFDVPAESGGALTVLNQYYDTALKDINNEWFFVISTPQLKEYGNVKVLRYPWIKKSWFHRLFFDRFVASKLARKYNVDEVLSLQNVVVPRIKVKQTLYLHQSLPFAEKRYKLNENFKFWVYQNVIGKLIFKSIKQADKVIVQTKWIRDAAIKKTGVKKEKFIVKHPKLNLTVKKIYSMEEKDSKLFFYPASGMDYKNHRIIVGACKKLMHEGINNYNIIFTLEGNENEEIKKLYEISKHNNFPIQFVGSLNINEVYEYYSKSTLVFPSYIETFGLPLLEARRHNTPILASDCAFSHEVLDGYNRVEFFDPFDETDLSLKMQNSLKMNVI